MKVVTALALGLLVLTPACGGRDPVAEGDLRAAVERTISAESYHVRMRLTQRGAGMQSIEGDYLAPDRFSVQGTAVTTLVIGRNRYISSPEDANRFYVAGKLSCAVAAGEFFPPLAVFREAQSVSRVGGRYTFKLDSLAKGAWGRARIRGGRIASLSLHYELPMFDGPSAYRFTFSDFDAPIAIEAPPAKQVMVDPRFEDLGPIADLKGSPIPCR